MTDEGTLDLDAYARRIGLPDASGLRTLSLAALHRAHLQAIAFENFDVLLKRPMPLPLSALQSKLVDGGRGGYCFETNLLLMASLQASGHRVRPLAARVLYRATKPLPRTHMLLLIEGPAGLQVADVGFGGPGLLEPLALRTDRVVDQGLGRFKLTMDGGVWTLWVEEGAQFVALYAFGLEAQTFQDLEMAHYFVATHPASRFTQTLVCQRVRRDERLTLRNAAFQRDALGGGSSVATLADHGAVLAALRDEFGLFLPSGVETMAYGRAF